MFDVTVMGLAYVKLFQMLLIVQYTKTSAITSERRGSTCLATLRVALLAQNWRSMRKKTKSSAHHIVELESMSEYSFHVKQIKFLFCKYHYIFFDEPSLIFFCKFYFQCTYPVLEFHDNILNGTIYQNLSVGLLYKL